MKAANNAPINMRRQRSSPFRQGKNKPPRANKSPGPVQFKSAAPGGRLSPITPMKLVPGTQPCQAPHKASLGFPGHVGHDQTTDGQHKNSAQYPGVFGLEGQGQEAQPQATRQQRLQHRWFQQTIRWPGTGQSHGHEEQGHGAKVQERRTGHLSAAKGITFRTPTCVTKKERPHPEQAQAWQPNRNPKGQHACSQKSPDQGDAKGCLA